MPLTAEPQDRKGRDTLNRPTAIQQESFTFPGILTEKYILNEAEEVYRTITCQRVLVTPKAVLLETGQTVDTLGKLWRVTACHTLADYQNEYRIQREANV